MIPDTLSDREKLFRLRQCSNDGENPGTTMNTFNSEPQTSRSPDTRPVQVSEAVPVGNQMYFFQFLVVHDDREKNRYISLRNSSFRLSGTVRIRFAGSVRVVSSLTSSR
jgi:hypothetical protein